MKISNEGITFIKEREAFRAIPYKDSAGKLTIGFGHLLKRGEVFGAISSVEATAIMLRDLVPAETSINTHVTITLEQYQYDALVSFTFNEGVAAFEGSTLLKKVNKKDIAGAASEFLRWDKEHVNGILVSSVGLLNRRKKERIIFMGGGYA